MLNIGIIGTRGIPNNYGGFEQLAQYLSAGLVAKGFSVVVYNSHNHPYKEDSWNGVTIAHCYDPEKYLGTAGQFIYDLNCTLDARKRKFDVLLILGYTSSSIWGWLYPRNTVCINHMDGLEWTRQKYNAATRKFLRYAERLAIRFGQFFIADARAIQSYLLKKYRIRSEYIAYGAEPVEEKYNLQESNKEPFCLLIARMEPENNIEMILDGMHLSNTENPFIVVGSVTNKFGKYLVQKYRDDKRICFAGPIYDATKTVVLKQNCALYFHGHSAGGTNPSLLEAMAAGAVVCAHDNIFNREVLNDSGLFFSTANDVKRQIEFLPNPNDRSLLSDKNKMKIRDQFNWPAIIEQYHQFIVACYQNRNK